jgi:ssDNA-binding Zn-finger/Zn-ribbon topoisomerase 1
MGEEPKCPKCESPMNVRVNRAEGTEFLGCSKYPDCKGTRKVSGPVQGNMTVSRELQELIDTSDDNDPF